MSSTNDIDHKFSDVSLDSKQSYNTELGDQDSGDGDGECGYSETKDEDSGEDDNPPEPPEILTTAETRLTFGVEIEFAVATLPDMRTDSKGTLRKKRDPDIGDTRPVFGLTRPVGSEPLRHDPHPGPGASDQDVEDYNLPRLELVKLHITKMLNAAGVPTINHDLSKDFDEPRDNRLAEEKAISSWQVSTDLTVEAPNKAYEWQAIEIKSPVYYFSAAAWMTVQKVCALLANNCRINCGETCGIHVHVGNARDGFDTETVRKLMSTIWTFEDHLSSLHPPNRQPDANQFCESLGRHSRMAAQNSMSSKPSRKPGLEWLLSARTKRDIIFNLVGGNERLAYNVWNLWPTSHFKRTIEFRQHESTLDADRVGHWIQLCVGLVEFASAVKREDLEKLLRKNVDKSIGDFGVATVLRVCSMEAQARFYGP